VKEEVVILQDLDQEASKNPDATPQDSLDQYFSTPLDLTRKASWAD